MKTKYYIILLCIICVLCGWFGYSEFSAQSSEVTVRIWSRQFHLNNNGVKYSVRCQELQDYLYVSSEMYENICLDSSIILGTPYRIKLHQEWTWFYGWPSKVWVISELKKL